MPLDILNMFPEGYVRIPDNKLFYPVAVNVDRELEERGMCCSMCDTGWV